MSRSRDGAPDLVRLEYADRAKLRGADLRALRDDGPARLGLHVVAAHGTFGVASGMELTLTADGRSVVVSPGAAFDCRGSALLLPESISLDPPEASAASRELEAVAGRAPELRPCAPLTGFEGCPPYDGRVLAAATVRWAPVGAPIDRADGRLWRARRAEEVLLGRFVVSANGTLTRSPRPGRSIAASRAPSTVHEGSVTLGNLTWVGNPQRETAWIDTSDAGFTATPAYVVSIEGLQPSAGAMPPIVHVTQATHDGLRIGFLGARPAGSLRLTWVGVQTVEGCPWTLKVPLFIPVGFLIGGLISE